MMHRKIVIPALVVLQLLAIVSHHGDAAILWFGGEDTSVVAVGSCVGSSQTTFIDTNFARGGVTTGNTTSTSDPPTNRCQTATFSASSTLWIHAAFGTATNNTTTNNEQAVIIRSPDGVARLLIRQTATAGTLKASKRDATPTITDLGSSFTGTFSGATRTTLDIQITYGCTAGDQLNVWLNSTQVFTFTGASLCTNAATTLNQVEFAGLNNSGSGGANGVCGNGTSGTCWSEMIVADEDTRSMRLSTLTLQSAGNTQQCTPSTLANVNKAVISDTTFISDATNNQLCQWKTPSSAPAGIWAVKSVSIEARALVSTTGPQNMDFSTRVSGSDYLAGTTTALTNSFANYRHQYDVSPATSAAWDINEVFNTSTNQMNIGIKTLP